MSFVANPPPSLMARKIKEEMQETGDGEDGPKKQSREDWKKMKELEEARKAGTAPAMKDEEGKDINPHIPQYIMQAPWYFGSEQPTLRHQRQQDEKQTSFARMDDWYKRGVKDGPVVSKFRKGACENCGAMTHKKKDCLERPRKIGARFTGSDIAPDEHIQLQLAHDFDGKRDRWNGYDPEEHQQKLQDDYLKMEEAKRILKEASLDTKLNSTEEMDDKADRDSDDEKYAEEMDMPGQKFETKQRITVRNLRIREDTAKYLFNLDVNSAFYDPKTRSMRENPFKSTGKEASELETKFAGDNFVRVSGNAMDMANTQGDLCMEAYERGVDVHLQADPTKLELLKKEFHSRQDTYKDTVRSSILDKYGGEEYLKSELPVAQSESYVEYSRHGTVIKGQEKAAVKSRYEEDVYPNNHTSVWGSYWRDGKWGYRCCHSLVKESYCTGEAGKEAYDEDIPLAITETAANPEEMGESQSLLEQHKNKLEEKKKSKNKKKKDKKRRKKKRRRHSSSSDSSSDDSDSDSDSEERKRKRLKKALKEEERHRAEVDKLMALDERKRPYNSMYEARAPTEEEMEAFRIKQMHPEDPMAHFNP